MWPPAVVCRGKETADGVADQGAPAAGGGTRAEADRLRTRIEELAEDLARAEEQVTRLAIAREEVTRVLEEPAAAVPPAGQDGETSAAGCWPPCSAE